MFIFMDKLPTAKRALILNMLVEGSSMRSISRVADVSINTVTKLLVDAGHVCDAYHDAKVRGVKAASVQCDEIWAFTYAKAKNVETAKRAGRRWRHLDLDRHRRRLQADRVGLSAGGMRDTPTNSCNDVASRLTNRVQLTTDGFKAYLDAVEGAFGADVDYAQLVKIYGAAPGKRQGRYSPARMHGDQKERDRRIAGQEAHFDFAMLRGKI